jgi:hypothetical protein
VNEENGATTQGVKILIGTPAYQGMVHTDFVHTLLDFRAADIDFELHTINRESLITRARNEIISTFWNRHEFSHLLFLDGDIRMTARGLQRLLGHCKDVIGAAVPLKGKDKQGNQPYNTDADMAAEPGLQVVQRVGTAVFMLSRSAATLLVMDAMREKRVYRIHELLKREGVPDLQYDIFGVGVRDGEYLSEDYWACESLKRLGYPIHVDTSVRVLHTGMRTFQ